MEASLLKLVERFVSQGPNGRPSRRSAMCSHKEATMSLTIRYGFLADSLFDGWSEDEMAGIDRDASVRSFAQQVEAAIREEHRGADIEVVWQSGRSGVKPDDLST